MADRNFREEVTIEVQVNESPRNSKLIDGVPSRTTVNQILARSSPTAGSRSVDDFDTGIVVAIAVSATVVLIALIALIVWLNCRRKRNKAKGLGVVLTHQPQPVQTANRSTIAVISDSTYLTNGGPYSHDAGPPSFRSIPEDPEDEYTEYGSVMGSFPPSPTLSFRSTLDGPAFSRSRTGTGTSFGTVASFGSDRTHRSRASTVASFHTCVEEEIS